MPFKIMRLSNPLYGDGDRLSATTQLTMVVVGDFLLVDATVQIRFPCRYPIEKQSWTG